MAIDERRIEKNIKLFSNMNASLGDTLKIFRSEIEKSHFNFLLVENKDNPVKEMIRLVQLNRLLSFLSQKNEKPNSHLVTLVNAISNHYRGLDSLTLIGEALLHQTRINYHSAQQLWESFVVNTVLAAEANKGNIHVYIDQFEKKIDDLNDTLGTFKLSIASSELQALLVPIKDNQNDELLRLIKLNQLLFALNQKSQNPKGDVERFLAEANQTYKDDFPSLESIFDKLKNPVYFFQVSKIFSNTKKSNHTDKTQTLIDKIKSLNLQQNNPEGDTQINDLPTSNGGKTP